MGFYILSMYSIVNCMINSQIGYHTFDCGEASLIAFDDYASDPVIKSHISSNRDPALFEGIITSWFFA